MKVIQQIKANKLFNKVNESDIKINVNQKDLLEIPEGEIIFQAGNSAEHIYLVLQGKVKLKHNIAIDGQKIFFKTENDFFGEREFLDNTSRNSSSVSETACILYILRRKEINDLISRNRTILNNLQGLNTPEEKEEQVTVDEFINEEEKIIEPENDFIKPDDENIEEEISAEIINTNNEPFKLSEEEKENFAKDFFKDYETSISDDTVKTENEEKIDWDFRRTIAEGKIDDIEESADELDNQIEKENISEDDEWNFQKETEKEELEKFKENFFKELKDEQEVSDETIIEKYDNEISSDVWDEKLDAAEKIESQVDESTWKIPIENEIEKELFPVERKEIQEQPAKSVLTIEQLKLIIEAAEKVNSNIKIDDVLKSIVDAACDLTMADRGTLYIVDSENDEIWSKVIEGEDVKEIRLTIGQGLAGWVAKTGEIINIKDASKDERFDKSTDITSGYKTKSMLCFPIKNKENEITGVIQLLNSGKGSFEEIDEEILEMLSVNIAFALSNAELVQQILRTDRVVSLGKVANFILSDIKNPILSVKHYAEHIKKKNITLDIKTVLDMIIDQVNMVNDIVQTTLSFSEGKAILKTRNQNLNSVMDEVLEKIAQYTETRKVKVFKKYDADVIINVDKNEFFQACFQITKNACDAMLDGGNFYISTQIENAVARISFKDNGLGIPSSILEKIFEPFFSHGKKNGVGLGIPISEKIIREHGGTLKVESDLGEGAVFTISLPIVT